MIEGQRRRLLRALNSRYIYGSIVGAPHGIRANYAPLVPSSSPRLTLVHAAASFARPRLPAPNGRRIYPNAQVQPILCKPTR